MSKAKALLTEYAEPKDKEFIRKLRQDLTDISSRIANYGEVEDEKIEDALDRAGKAIDNIRTELFRLQ